MKCPRNFNSEISNSNTFLNLVDELQSKIIENLFDYSSMIISNLDETNIYSADTEPESTQAAEQVQESHEAEESNDPEMLETEAQTQESVSQTEVAVQEESTVQYSLLERIEEYLIKFITYIVKLAAAYIGITL